MLPLPITDKLSALKIAPRRGSTFAGLSQPQIEQLEMLARSLLPDDVKAFLSQYGPTAFEEEVNCTPDSAPLYFGFFYSFNEIIDAIQSYRGALPTTVLPIADDGGGNLFCVGIGEANFGRMYFHHHSIGWGAEASQLLARGMQLPDHLQYETVCEIAPTFTALIRQMEME